ncbi:unnamed protein product [Linum trigynum]|uniref:AAA+ ATPase domain-containing protein n=1 Tax=Linum trigynum TaxID=586398 RepID=A0AAV2D1G0_9ROSI
METPQPHPKQALTTTPSPAAAAFLLSSVSSPITLKFVDLCYRVKLPTSASNTGSTIRRLISPHEKSTAAIEQRTILSGITGTASPGEILAVLGPSGSGKSTLLHALAGRRHRGGVVTGTILAAATTAASKKLSARQLARRTGFVAQDDVLFPHLTVRETLVFCALLRATYSSRDEKMAAAEWAIAELGLGIL